MRPYKFSILLLIFLLPLMLGGCNFAFGPGGGGQTRVVGSKGVFKSFDKGQAWTEQNTLIESEFNLAGHNVHHLAFDIADSSIIYIGTNAGLYLSQDAGQSWRQLNTLPITTFALNPKTRGVIYISTGTQIYKTTDNGENWQLLYTEARPAVAIIDIGISLFDSSYIYLLTNDGYLLLSSDWGDSWKKIHNFERIRAKQLILSPYNNNHLFVGVENGLYRSLDGGENWQEILRERSKDFSAIERFKRLLYTYTEDELLYLCQYGILKSSDNGDSWQAVRLISMPNSIELHTFTFNPLDKDEIYYAIANVFYHSFDGGRNWQTKVLPVPPGTRASQFLVDRVDSNLIYMGITQ